MKQTRFELNDRVSASVCAVIHRRKSAIRNAAAARAAGVLGEDAGEPVLSVILEATDAVTELPALATYESIVPLADGFYSGTLRADTLRQLTNNPAVTRIQSKKQSSPHLDEVGRHVGMFPALGTDRVIREDGTGIFVGVIDSGFDLSHPTFRDSSGRLRVAGLLDQQGGDHVYSTGQLHAALVAGGQPGADQVGHGTHVASIAAGSQFAGIEGVAPAAKLLLVRTNYVDTDRAVKWIFDQAGDVPCVVNLSLGHHMGAHDGTDSEERLHERLSRPGRIIVVSAGNEREDAIHAGSEFWQGEHQHWRFNVLVQDPEDGPFAHVTLWHDDEDRFEVSLIAPNGAVMAVPAVGQPGASYETPVWQVELSSQAYVWSRAVKLQVSLSFDKDTSALRHLRGWGLRITCATAKAGRLDAWFNNSSFGEFSDGPWVERLGTIGLPATGNAAIAVASHVCRTHWSSDDGNETDPRIVLGRSSPFSSLGPTRDGRAKPEVSAPGQYVRAALAEGCTLGRHANRTQVASRIVALEGTSMSAPVVTGVVALMLQKKGTLDASQLRDILSRASRRDRQTGSGLWHPAYGFGKLDAAAMLEAI